MHRSCVVLTIICPTIVFEQRENFPPPPLGESFSPLVRGKSVSPGNVVGDGCCAQGDDASPGPAVGAQGSGLERPAHGHVSLHGDAQRQVRGRRLRDQPDRVDHAGDVGKHLPVVPGEQGARVQVHRGQAEHQDTGTEVPHVSG